MKALRLLLQALGLAAAATALAAPAPADTPRDAALGMTGEVYLAQSGPYAELFPEGTPPGDPDDPVLAVDVLVPGQPSERLLVPETEGAQSEGQPSLVFEDATESLFVVWESKEGPALSRINLVWLHGGTWSPVIEVSGDISPLKGPPQVALTRDAFEVEADGEISTHERTVIHVAWWEQAPSAAEEEIYYTPIVLEDGAYLGSNPVYNLSELDPQPAPLAPAGLPSDLCRAPAVGFGRDARSVVVGFANPRSERFVSFEMQLVPGEISVLGRQLADFILAHSELYTPADLSNLADRARAHFVDIGYRLHPALAAYLAAKIWDFILDFGPGDPGGASALADRARAHFVDIGARISGDGGLAGGGAAAVDEILNLSPGTGAAMDHALRLRLVASWSAPATGSGDTWIFLSEDGSNALVSWEEAGDRLYRETTGTGWTEIHRLVLDGSLDLTRAEQILRQRVREH